MLSPFVWSWAEYATTRTLGNLEEQTHASGSSLQSVLQAQVQSLTLSLRFHRRLGAGYERSYRAIDLCTAWKLCFPARDPLQLVSP